MKSISVIFTFILTTQGALAACPELAGKYKQKGNDSSTQLVSESTQNGVKVYNFGEGSAPINTDGVAHSLGQGVSAKSTCGDNTITTEIVAPNGEVVRGLIMKTDSGYTTSSNNPSLMGPDSEWIKQ